MSEEGEEGLVVDEATAGVCANVESQSSENKILVAFFRLPEETGDDTLYISGPHPKHINCLLDPLRRDAVMKMHGFTERERGSYHWQRCADKLKDMSSNGVKGCDIVSVYSLETVSATNVMAGVVDNDGSGWRMSYARAAAIPFATEIIGRRMKFANDIANVSWNDESEQLQRRRIEQRASKRSDVSSDSPEFHMQLRSQDGGNV